LKAAVEKQRHEE